MRGQAGGRRRLRNGEEVAQQADEGNFVEIRRI